MKAVVHASTSNSGVSAHRTCSVSLRSLKTRSMRDIHALASLLEVVRPREELRGGTGEAP